MSISALTTPPCSQSEPSARRNSSRNGSRISTRPFDDVSSARPRNRMYGEWLRLSGSNDHLAEHLAAGQRDLALRGALEGEHAVDDRREPSREGVRGEPPQL